MMTIIRHSDTSAVRLKETSNIVVECIFLHRVRIALCEPFRISNGQVTEKDSILVEVKTTNGLSGWGEASPMSGSFYSEDTPESVWAALSGQLIPLTLNEIAI